MYCAQNRHRNSRSRQLILLHAKRPHRSHRARPNHAHKLRRRLVLPRLSLFNLNRPVRRVQNRAHANTHNRCVSSLPNRHSPSNLPGSVRAANRRLKQVHHRTQQRHKQRPPVRHLPKKAWCHPHKRLQPIRKLMPSVAKV
jgi:hypothetical protein